MRKIAIVGGSHVAALKAAWPTVRENDTWQGVDVTFFASHTTYFHYLKISEDFVLMPPPGDWKDSCSGDTMLENLMRLNGRTQLKLGSFDRVFLAGFTDPFIALFPERALFSTLLDYDIPNFRGYSSQKSMALDTFQKLIVGLAQSRLPPPMWVKKGMPPVSCIFRPMISETSQKINRDGLNIVKRISKRPIGCRKSLDMFLDAFGTGLSDMGITAIRQPEKTQNRMGMTLDKYNRSPVSIDRHPRELDPYHMNAEYGAICLNEFAKRSKP